MPLQPIQSLLWDTRMHTGKKTSFSKGKDARKLHERPSHCCFSQWCSEQVVAAVSEKQNLSLAFFTFRWCAKIDLMWRAVAQNHSTKETCFKEEKEQAQNRSSVDLQVFHHLFTKTYILSHTELSTCIHANATKWRTKSLSDILLFPAYKIKTIKARSVL